MLKNNWSIKEEIQKRANLESEVEYWANLSRPTLPKYSKVKVVKNKPGWVNFFLQLKP